MSRQGYYDDELDQIRKAEKWADGIIADESFRNAIPSGVTIADSLGRFGLKKGQEWILKAQYDSLAPAAAGIFIAAKDGKFGACDSWGRTVLGCEFASVVYQPEAELYIVSDENGKFGLYRVRNLHGVFTVFTLNNRRNGAVCRRVHAAFVNEGQNTRGGERHFRVRAFA